MSTKYVNSGNKEAATTQVTITRGGTRYGNIKKVSKKDGHQSIHLDYHNVYNQDQWSGTFGYFQKQRRISV